MDGISNPYAGINRIRFDGSLSVEKRAVFGCASPHPVENDLV
jgi:hypothetical protein